MEVTFEEMLAERELAKLKLEHDYCEWHLRHERARELVTTLRDLRQQFPTAEVRGWGGNGCPGKFEVRVWADGNAPADHGLVEYHAQARFATQRFVFHNEGCGGAKPFVKNVNNGLCECRGVEEIKR